MKMTIESEGDIEIGIKTMLRLAVLDGKKTIMLCFPSQFMCKIFLNNVLDTFESLNIEEPVNIDAILVIPE
jgi:hypothetical protein